jgi:hypothetical protein
MTRYFTMVADQLLDAFVKKADAAAACPPERYAQHCYCNCPSALAYYRWCTVQSTYAVKRGPCRPSNIRCCV